MKVLVITGDKTFKAGHPRFDLQASAVEVLGVVYWGAGALWPQIPKGGFDVVTAQDPFFRGLFAWTVARRLKARFNVQVHADIAAQTFIKHVLAQIVLRHADSIRVVSDRVRVQVAHYIGHRMTNVTVLPVFVDVGRFQKIMRKPDPKPTVLWIGRFEDEKDPLRALEVFREVCEQGVEAKLIMLGAGTMEGALRERAIGMPVEFPGWQDPVPYVARAHVVLSTSHAESFGASILEALAAGVPVVAPDVGIAREAGATVVPRERLASAVVEVLRAPRSVRLTLRLLSAEEWKAAWVTTLA